MGHQNLLDGVRRHLEDAHPAYGSSLTLLGTGFHGIGVGDCIGHAKFAAEKYHQSTTEAVRVHMLEWVRGADETSLKRAYRAFAK